MALKEYKPEKLLYTMGEVTEMFDVKPSLIRFWEQRFDILKPKKNKKGNRLFTPADVKNLELIYHLTKERGMTLSGVEKYLKNNKDEAIRETEIVRRLQTIRSLLVEIREELKEDADGEISIILTEEPEAETIAETFTEISVSEKIIRPAEEPAPEPISKPATEPEIPNPLEFTEEVLPGEIDGDNIDDFWSDELAVEEMRADEESEPAGEESFTPEEAAFEGYSDEEDSFGLERAGNSLPVAPETVPDELEPEAWEKEEEEVVDEEVSVPFTAQPLFDLEESQEVIAEEVPEEPQPEEIAKPTAFDTQQSLF